MKKLPLGLAMNAALLMMTGVAFGDGLLESKERYVPRPVYAAPFSWTGFYIGLNAGGSWSTYDTSATNVLALAALGGPNVALAINNIANFGTSGAGFIGGGQVGYNWQLSPSEVSKVRP